MAALFADGFDYYNAVNDTTPLGLRSRWTSSGANFHVGTLISGRFDGQAFRAFDSTQPSNDYGYQTMTAGTTRAGGCSAYIGKLPAAATRLFALSNNAARQVSVNINSDGSLALQSDAGGTLVTSAAGVVAAGQWFSLELEVVHHTSTGEARAWVNGTLVASVTGVNTTDGSATSINAVLIYVQGDLRVASDPQRFDDVYGATARPSFTVGPRVHTMAPAGEVSVQYVPQTGTDNAAMLPVPWDTQYNQSSANGALDTDVLSVPSLPVDAEAPIESVGIRGVARGVLSTTNALWRVRLRAGATTQEGSEVSITGATDVAASLFTTQNPDTAAAWQLSDFSDFDFGYRTTQLASNRVLRVRGAAAVILMGAPTPPPQGLEVTQAPVLALATFEADGQVTQALGLALVETAPDARVTQAATLAIAEFTPDAAITQTAILALVKESPCHTRTAQCWKITRKDGQVYGFTTHDRRITYQGTAYEPCASLKATAFMDTAYAGAASGDVQAKGIIDDDAISERDLYVGLFDDARIDVFLVDWQTGDGRTLTRGIAGRADLVDGVTYAITGRTGGARLEQQPLLNTYSPACRWEFGDSRCKFNVEAQRVFSSVTGVRDRDVVRQARRRSFMDSARTEPVTTYRNARITWESGAANAGIVSEVKDIVSGVVTLWHPTPFDIEPGDAYSIVPGCPKTKEACLTFNNFENFGGFPDLPGSDALNEVPEPR